uniref:BTB domain-containing protein n=1 Tax=Bracon brevicornis TaxID=1563983 RepID=A0A6V7JS67_9HYME
MSSTADADNSKIKRTLEVYQWTIKDFDKLSDKPGLGLESPIFSSGMDNDQWNFHFYPRGRNEDSKDYFSLYIVLDKTNKPEISVRYKLSIYNFTTGGRDFVKGSQVRFSTAMSSGMRRFVKRSEVFIRRDNYIVNNELIICCEFDFEMRDEFGFSSDSIPKVNSVTNDIWSFFERSKFSDISLVAGKKTFHCHKMILAARSTVFSAMLEQNADSKTSRNMEIQLDNMEPTVAREMLRFIYTGKVKKFDGKMIAGLLSAAEKYKLSDLKVICETELYGKMCYDNAASTLITAHLFHLKELKDHCIKFINKYLSKVIHTTGYNNLEAEYPALLGELLRAQAADDKGRAACNTVPNRTIKEEI